MTCGRAQPQLCSRSAPVNVVRIRPGTARMTAPALARAYANLGEQSRYRRFLHGHARGLPEATLKAAV